MIRRLSVLFAFALSLSAAPFSRIGAFGDSLADNGNLFALTGNTFPPSPPYFNGRASNGPVAVEYLSELLGTPLVDFAVYGATTGLGNLVDGGSTAVSNGLPGVLSEYTEALGRGFSVNSSDLYVILGGPANDFRSGLTLPALQTALTNQIALVTLLQSKGAQNIIVAGLPDLGLIPFVAQNGPAAAQVASLFSQGYNDALKKALPSGVKFFNLSAILYAAYADPSFTNKTQPCVVGTTVCSDSDSYIFWDEFHPTTRVHALAGAGLASAVPEPATFLCFAGGLAIVLGLRRRSNSGRHHS
jgi:phospholipase/lecithinase/hemolysin